MRGGFAGFFNISGFSRIDALEDAQSPEIRQGDLKFAHSLSSGDVVLRLARLALLLLFRHVSETIYEVNCVSEELFSSRRGKKVREFGEIRAGVLPFL